MQELEQLNGSGQAGRVTKKDILDFVQNRSTGNVQPAKSIENTATKTA